MKKEPALHAARLFGSRFLGLYLAFFCLPFPLIYMQREGAYERVWRAVIPWLGRIVFGLESVPFVPTGSGDTAYRYLLLLCLLVVASVAAAVWTAVDRTGRADAVFQRAVRIYLRYFLAFEMFAYGFAKVFKSQFAAPGLHTLLTTYGDSSPMLLLWTFMGFSTAYTVFAGLAEVVGGALLLFRRTTTAGALVIAAVMTNVFMLNMCYDVPVKAASAHLLFIALYLAAPGLPRLADVLFFNKATHPAPMEPYPEWAEGRWGRSLKAMFITLLLIPQVGIPLMSYRRSGDAGTRPMRYGFYDFEGVPKPGGLLSPGESVYQWRDVGVDLKFFYVRRKDGGLRRFTLTDGQPGLIVLSPDEGKDSGEKVWMLEPSFPDDQHLLLQGFGPDKDIRLLLRRKDLPLNARGFHWISEKPFLK